MKKRITTILIGIMVMGVTSLVVLMIVSVLTYWLKWTADEAMLGITLAYIITGLVGGLAIKWIPRLWSQRHKDILLVEEMDIGFGKKILEGALAGSVFMILLVILSAFLKLDEIQMSGRLFLVWMLLSGSTALARIL